MRRVCFLLLCSLALFGCVEVASTPTVITARIEPTSTAQRPSPTATSVPTHTPNPTSFPTTTPLPSQTSTAQPTVTFSPTPTPLPEAQVTLIPLAELDVIFSAEAYPLLFTQHLPYQGEGRLRHYIIAASVDFQHQILLTNPDDGFYAPQWFPDGNRILMTKASYLVDDPKPYGQEVYQLDLKTGDVERITENGTHEQDVTLSPDGKQFAFRGVSEEDKRGFLVYDIETDQTQSLQVSPSGGFRSDWSPVEAKVVYSSHYDLLPHGIYIVDVESGEQIFLDNAEESEEWWSYDHPAYSPDGRTIAYKAYGPFDTNRHALMLINSDGSNRRVLADWEQLGANVGWFNITWNPNGKSVVVVSRNRGLLEVDIETGEITPFHDEAYTDLEWYRPNLQWSSALKPITILPTDNYKWSPTSEEGAYLDCQSQADTPIELFKVHAPDFESVNITPSVDQPLTCFATFGIEWRPNGQHLLFNASVGFGDSNLWIVDRTGQNPRILDDRGHRLTDVLQWLDDDRFLYSIYASGGHRVTILLNAATGVQEGHLPFAWGYHVGIGKNYSSWTPNSFQFWHLPYVNQFPDREGLTDYDRQESQVIFPKETGVAVSQGWIPQSDKMLVRTWREVDSEIILTGVYELRERADVDSDVYLWDVAANEAHLLVAGGRHAAIQPKGDLVAVTTRNNFTETHIIDLATETTLDSFPSSDTQPQWLSDNHLLYDGKIRNIATGAEIAVVHQREFGHFYDEISLSPSGDHLSVRDCVLDQLLNCTTHILAVTLP